MSSIVSFHLPLETLQIELQIEDIILNAGSV